MDDNIRSAREIALEKAESVGEATEEERLQWKYLPQGEKLAARYLREDCSLDIKGMLGIVRHPWYSGGILIVWARNLDVTAIITNLVITAYFIVGAFLEERKLLAEFGAEYKNYQRSVSMLFPLKWAARKLRFKKTTT